jgi:tRNA(fMet)-specific endonuclease VapC
MSLFVLDTDHLTLYYCGDPIVVRRVDARPSADLAISIITVDEQITAWYTLTRRARQPGENARACAHLGDAVVRLAKWRILPYTESANARVAQLQALRLNVRLMGLRIAAIALENGAVVVTRNRRDFGRVPGLNIGDWSVLSDSVVWGFGTAMRPVHLAVSLFGKMKAAQAFRLKTGEFHCRGSNTAVNHRKSSKTVKIPGKPLEAGVYNPSSYQATPNGTHDRSIRDREVAGSNPVAPTGN